MPECNRVTYPSSTATCACQALTWTVTVYSMHQARQMLPDAPARASGATVLFGLVPVFTPDLDAHACEYVGEGDLSELIRGLVSLLKALASPTGTERPWYSPIRNRIQLAARTRRSRCFPSAAACPAARCDRVTEHGPMRRRRSFVDFGTERKRDEVSTGERTGTRSITPDQDAATWCSGGRWGHGVSASASVSPRCEPRMCIPLS